MRRGAEPREPAVAVVLAVVVLAVAAFRPFPQVPTDLRPNIVVILSDDQSFDSLPHDPPVMPRLQATIDDHNGHWVSFPNAFVSTPLCCPSRATILTGRYSHNTGVQTNDLADLLDDGSTVATWLQGAGYYTGLFGKYLNGYPFGYSTFVPPGWDRWLGRLQAGQSSLYYNYVLVDQGFPVAHGSAPSDYSTDVHAAAAADFIRTAPADRPFFLAVTPSGPHRPWTPAPRDTGAYADMAIAAPGSIGEGDVSDKPAWVRALRPMSRERLQQLDGIHRRSFETLRSVDRLVAGVVKALRRRGALDRTIIFFLTDNGFSFGAHRWTSKGCPYEECVRTPFFVRVPGAVARVDGHLISNVDLAPTFAELAGSAPASPVDGRSLVPLLEGSTVPDWPDGVLLEYVGDAHIPPWRAIRTEEFAYVEYATGERELYDLTGRLGSPDPYELENRVSDPAYAGLRADLAARLERLAG
ncbi:MAG: sulfatase [Actinomycetota bacterium]